MENFKLGSRSNGFPPVVGENPQILILGEFPSKTSLGKKEYYSGAGNQFWPIIDKLFNGNGGFLTYNAKLQCLKKNHIALWTLYGSADGDGKISGVPLLNAKLNDIPSFLSEHPGINKVLCNGKDVASSFRLYFPELVSKLTCIISLTSTTSYAGQKVARYEEWRDALGK